jgi:hypothetical protein
MRRLQEHGLVVKGDLHIAGMNGFLLSVAEQRGMEGICLLVIKQSCTEFIEYFTVPLRERPREDEEKN